MIYHVEFICQIENCPYGTKIITATRQEIIKHLREHDYSILLDESVKYNLIKNKSERRSPQWLSENLTDLFMGEVNYQ